MNLFAASFLPLVCSFLGLLCLLCSLAAHNKAEPPFPSLTIPDKPRKPSKYEKIVKPRPRKCSLCARSFEGAEQLPGRVTLMAIWNLRKRWRSIESTPKGIAAVSGAGEWEL